jgi:methyl-accepting chemotaxis protein
MPGRHLTIRTRITILSVVLPTLLFGALFALWARQERAQIDRAVTDKSRAIALAAEGTRQTMEAAWQDGVFSAATVRAAAEAGDLDRALASVPVVAAWRSVMANSEAGGYRFKVPRFEPRNPANAPDPIEAAALRRLRTEQLPELSVHDPETNAIRYFRPVRLTETCLVCHGDPARSAALWGNSQGHDPTGSPMEGWQAGEIHGAFEIIQSLDAADARYAASLRTMGGVIAAGLILMVLLLNWTLRRLLVRPLAQAAAHADALAGGDLRHDLDTGGRQDEIGALGDALNRMTARFREILTDLRQGSATLRRSSESLGGQSVRLVEDSETMTEVAGTVTAAGEELSTSISGIAEGATAMATRLDDVAESIRELHHSVSEVAGQSGRSAEVARAAKGKSDVASGAMADLKTAAGRIGSILHAIAEIAEQTNLLALNATIEAARAGEAGRGFGIVAAEVKELARQTARATGEIEQEIAAIQGRTDAAVESVSGIAGVIGEVNDIAGAIAAAVEQQSATLGGIASSGTEASASAQEITRQVQEGAVGTQEIARSMVTVREGLQQNDAGVRAARENAARLQDLAGRVDAIVSSFRVEAGPAPAGEETVTG